MAVEFLTRLTDEMTIALAFGLAAFILHLIGYAWYSLETIRGHTRPNAATWLMWLFGAWVEFYTYNAIESHWSTSALPLACLVGIGTITAVTIFLQLRFWLRGGSGVVYEPSDPKDYLLIGADIGALVLYLATGGAFWANFIAVSTSIVTFVPIWKTTLRSDQERPGPWVVWCLAYVAMWMAVLSEENEVMNLELQFYPLYYLFLHGVMAFLASRGLRAKLARWLAMAATAIQPAGMASK